MTRAWQIQKSRTPFKNRWLTLAIDTLKTPAQKSQDYTYITRHPGVVVVAFFKTQNQLLLVSQYRHPLKKTIWQLPGGSKPKSKTFKQTALAELQEETGYTVKTLTDLGPIHPDAGIIAATGRAFLATNPTKMHHKKPSTDPHELVTCRKFTLHQTLNLIKAGKVRDGWTLSAFLLFLIHQNKINA